MVAGQGRYQNRRCDVEEIYHQGLIQAANGTKHSPASWQDSPAGGFLSDHFCRMTVACWGACILLSDMAADSFRNSSEAMSDTFLAALALKWRELRDAPQLAAGTLGFSRRAKPSRCAACARDAAAIGAPPRPLPASGAPCVAMLPPRVASRPSMSPAAM